MAGSPDSAVDRLRGSPGVLQVGVERLLRPVLRGIDLDRVTGLADRRRADQQAFVIVGVQCLCVGAGVDLDRLVSVRDGWRAGQQVVVRFHGLRSAIRVQQVVHLDRSGRARLSVRRLIAFDRLPETFVQRLVDLHRAAGVRVGGRRPRIVRVHRLLEPRVFERTVHFHRAGVVGFARRSQRSVAVHRLRDAAVLGFDRTIHLDGLPCFSDRGRSGRLIRIHGLPQALIFFPAVDADRGALAADGERTRLEIVAVDRLPQSSFVICGRDLHRGIVFDRRERTEQRLVGVHRLREVFLVAVEGRVRVDGLVQFPIVGHLRQRVSASTVSKRRLSSLLSPST